MSHPCVLIAADKTLLPAIKPSLSPNRLVLADNISQVLQVIQEQQVDLFLVDIYFDDSKALDLVAVIRANQSYKRTPILLFRLLPSKHAELLRYTVLQMTPVHKIACYMELDNSPDAVSEISTAVHKYLSN
jgi:response regulator RpfG family c-di-GMP phosphodiesterase